MPRYVKPKESAPQELGGDTSYENIVDRSLPEAEERKFVGYKDTGELFSEPIYEDTPLTDARTRDLGREAVRQEYTWGGSELHRIPGTESIVGPKGFELTVTKELKNRAQGMSFGELRKEFEAAIEKIEKEPFGDANIDHFKDEDSGQWARLVHEVGGKLGSLAEHGKMVIKTTGLDMERTRKCLELFGPHRSDLRTQFIRTLEVQRTMDKLKQEPSENSRYITDIFSVANVYGYVSSGEGEDQREWLLMDYAPGSPMENIEYNAAVFSGPSLRLGFDADENPLLADITGGSCWYETLQEAIKIGTGYAVSLSDLTGNNIHKTGDGNDAHYTLIDVGGI
jgi:hypothetical protein